MLAATTARSKFFRKPSRAITSDANGVRPYAVRNGEREGGEKGEKSQGNRKERSRLRRERRVDFFAFSTRDRPSLRNYVVHVWPARRAAPTTRWYARFWTWRKRAVKLAPHNARLLKGSRSRTGPRVSPPSPLSRNYVVDDDDDDEEEDDVDDDVSRDMERLMSVGGTCGAPLRAFCKSVPGPCIGLLLCIDPSIICVAPTTRRRKAKRKQRLSDAASLF